MRFRQLSLAILILLIPPIPVFSQGVIDPYYHNDGVIGIVRALRRVDCGVRVLHVAAHPDDEDSAMLAYLSLGRGARVTYMSLTRGEGGQNGIGPEMGAELGVIRTEELLAARKIDGCTQLFGREIDFGFSKSPEECFQKWGREEIVKDIVRAIRYTKPHIIISRFQGNAKDGHGQHQAAAICAREAFTAAADPNRFPELLKDGLEPWQAQKFYIGSFEDTPEVTTRIDTAAYDPWLGKSYAAIGYHGRSQHRSQDMGMIEYEEPRFPSLYILESPKPEPEFKEDDIFDNLKIDPQEISPSPAELLNLLGTLEDPGIVAPPLAELIQKWEEKSSRDEAAIKDLQTALGIALGIRLDALSEKQAVFLGGSQAVSSVAYIPAGMNEIENAEWSVSVAEGLSSERSADRPEAGEIFNRVEARFTIGASVQASIEAPLTSPYYLKLSPESTHDLYVWLGNIQVGFPFSHAAAESIFQCAYQGAQLSLTVPVEYRSADPNRGEIREEMAVLPPALIRFFPSRRVARRSGAGTLDPPVLEVKNLTEGDFDGAVAIRYGCTPWKETEDPAFTTSNLELRLKASELRRFKLEELSIPSDCPLGVFTASCASLPCIAYDINYVYYPHIRAHYISQRLPAATVTYPDVALPEGLSVGYVRGLGDEIESTIRQLGIMTAFIEAQTLGDADLAKLDAVVLGPRAYEAHPELAANNEKLLDYVRNGGTLIVQYNKYEPFEKDHVAPFPMKMSHPHDRVTDETAAVTILESNHPIFNYPNKITQKDFEGWIQERGLYFWSSWDDAYKPLLSMADPNEPQQKGGLLVAKIGKGNYIYTGISFFRQLPAGAEGPIRLFVNLISMGRAGGK